MRVVVDTNVLISGLISSKSFPAKVVDLWVAAKFEPVVSGEIITEYSAVLTRDRFSIMGSIKERLDLLSSLLSLDHIVLVEPRQRLVVIKDDPKDNIFLECAEAGECKIIVSGDHHLLKLKEWRDVKIVSPQDFVLNLIEEESPIE